MNFSEVVEVTVKFVFEDIGIWNLAAFLVATSLTIFFYHRSNKKRKPFFLIKNLSLFEDKVDTIDSLEIKYDGKTVNHFSVAHVAIWNGGGETINKSDVAPKSKIRIVAKEEGAEIMGAKIVFVNNKANNFLVRLLERPKRRLGVYFDYLDKNEGVIIQVFHSGKSKNSICVEGSIKGCGKIRCAENGFTNSVVDTVDFLTGEKIFKKIHLKYKKIIMGLAIFALPFFPLIEIFFPSVVEPTNLRMSIILSLILAVLYWPIGFLLLKRRVPKELSVFEDM